MITIVDLLELGSELDDAADHLGRAGEIASRVDKECENNIDDAWGHLSKAFKRYQIVRELD